MIVVIASQHDGAASAFARAHPQAGMAVLTTKDLSRRGWFDDLQGTTSGTAVVDGHRTPVREIDGVLTLQSSLHSDDLSHVARRDRGYVAWEMTAFLVAWLASLPCPVLNRPTPPFLTSPCWAPERWALAARELGIPVTPTERSAALSGAPVAPAITEDRCSELEAGTYVSVTVVGDQCAGSTSEPYATYARALAAFAGVDLLTARFTQPPGDARLIDATGVPDVASPEVASAILRHLRRWAATEPRR